MDTHLKVSIRVRPPNAKELQQFSIGINEEGEPVYDAISIPNPQTIIVKKQFESKTFEFDHVFGSHVDQSEVFEKVALHTLMDVFQGYHSTLFVYGQTGTGKTHTISCHDQTNPGIIQRSVKYMFERAQEEVDQFEYTFSMNYVQIYMEMIQDLLNPENTNLQLREDPETGIFIPHVCTLKLNSYEECMKYYEMGNENRVTALTRMNAQSSRSHVCVMISVSKRQRISLQVLDQQQQQEQRHVLHGKLYLVDLAGSERLKKTAATGIRRQEANYINLSLTNLGIVINALESGKQHVPFRDSKLTRLLQDSLSGNGKTNIIVTVGPCSEHIQETISSLQFGQRALKVKTKAKIYQEIDYRALALKLQTQLDELENKKTELEREVLQCYDVNDQLELEIQTCKNHYEREIQVIKSDFEKEIQLLTSEYETEKDSLLIMLEGNFQETQNENFQMLKDLNSKLDKMKQESIQYHQEKRELLNQMEQLKSQIPPDSIKDIIEEYYKMKMTMIQTESNTSIIVSSSLVPPLPLPLPSSSSIPYSPPPSSPPPASPPPSLPPFSIPLPDSSSIPLPDSSSSPPPSSSPLHSPPKSSSPLPSPPPSPKQHTQPHEQYIQLLQQVIHNLSIALESKSNTSSTIANDLKEFHIFHHQQIQLLQEQYENQIKSIRFEMEQQSNQYESKLDQSYSSHSILQSKYQQVEEEKKNSMENYQQLQKEYQQLQEEWIQKYQQLEMEKNQLHDTCQQVNNTLKLYQSENETKLQQLQEQYDQLHERYHTLHEEHDQRNEQYHTLYEQYHQNSEQYNQRNEQYDQLYEEYNQKSEQYKQLHEKNKLIEEEYAQYKLNREQQNQQLKMEYEQLKDRYEQLKDRYEQCKKQYNQMEEEHEQLKEEFDFSKMKHQQLKEEHEQFAKQFHQMEEEKNQQYKQLQEEKNQLLLQHEQVMTSLQEQCNKLETENMGYKLELQSREMNQTELHVTLQENNKELQHCKMELEHCKMELEHCKVELEEARVTLKQKEQEGEGWRQRMNDLEHVLASKQKSMEQVVQLTSEKLTWIQHYQHDLSLTTTPLQQEEQEQHEEEQEEHEEEQEEQEASIVTIIYSMQYMTMDHLNQLEQLLTKYERELIQSNVTHWLQNVTIQIQQSDSLEKITNDMIHSIDYYHSHVVSKTSLDENNSYMNWMIQRQLSSPLIKEPLTIPHDHPNLTYMNILLWNDMMIIKSALKETCKELSSLNSSYELYRVEKYARIVQSVFRRRREKKKLREWRSVIDKKQREMEKSKNELQHYLKQNLSKTGIFLLKKSITDLDQLFKSWNHYFLSPVGGEEND